MDKGCEGMVCIFTLYGDNPGKELYLSTVDNVNQGVWVYLISGCG